MNDTNSKDNLQDGLQKSIDEQASESNSCSAEIDSTEGDSAGAYIDISWKLNNKTGELHAVVSKCDTNANWNVNTITQSLDEHGYAEYNIGEDSRKDLLKMVSEEETGSFLFAKRVDARVKITVSSDSMRAEISLNKAQGGEPLTMEKLVAYIEEQGIDLPLCDQQVMEHMIENQDASLVTLAEGTQPEHGEDSEFELLVKSVRELELEEDEDGVVDMRMLQEFTIVEPGESLMRRKPPTQGIAGVDIFGKAIPPNAGIEVPFSSKLEGAEVHVLDANLLVAAVQGHPEISDAGVSVVNLLTVDDVGVKTGNISFDGSLLVKGEVGAGMTIEVTGGVVVRGIVVRASITAGKSIEIAGGAMGEEKSTSSDVCEYSCVLEAGGSISAQFVTGVSIQTKSVLEVKEYISRSNVYARMGVHIGQNGGKGYLIGGHCHSDREVLANVIGTDANIITHVSVGYGGVLLNRYSHLKDESLVRIDQKKTLDEMLRRNIDEYKQSPEGISNARNLRVMVKALRGMNVDLEDIVEEIEEIRDVLAFAEDANVTVKRCTYPNSIVTINAQAIKMEQETKGVVYTRQEKRVVYHAV
ncbi:MAG: FapA family protein [Pseudomonadales bacterium]|nr:FapA family protein [Pseudomonadales bacterium]